MSKETLRSESAEPAPVAAFREFCRETHPSTIKAKAASIYLQLELLYKDNDEDNPLIKDQIVQLETLHVLFRGESGYMKGFFETKQAYNTFLTGMYEFENGHQITDRQIWALALTQLANDIFEQRMTEKPY